jgi:hypothetical protein
MLVCGGFTEGGLCFFISNVRKKLKLNENKHIWKNNLNMREDKGNKKVLCVLFVRV